MQRLPLSPSSPGSNQLVSRWFCRGLGAAVAAAVLVAAPAASVQAAGTEQTEAAPTREVVDLKLRIASGEEAVVELAQLVELDTDTSLALEADGHRHAVALNVHKADDRGRKLKVTLGYERDGEPVLETVTVEAAAKKPKVIRSEQGDVALSLRMATKTVSAEELPPPAPKRPRIEVDGDTNDPLAGLD